MAGNAPRLNPDLTMSSAREWTSKPKIKKVVRIVFFFIAVIIRELTFLLRSSQAVLNQGQKYRYFAIYKDSVSKN
jgi:hypothetical protein